MAESLTQYLEQHKAKGFTARPHYFAEGDYVSYYLRDERCYAKRVDDLLTMYLAMNTNELLGCKIKGVRRLLQTLGNFGIAIEDEHGQIRLGMLFLAAFMNSDSPQKGEYERVGKLVGDAPIGKQELALATG